MKRIVYRFLVAISFIEISLMAISLMAMIEAPVIASAETRRITAALCA